MKPVDLLFEQILVFAAILSLIYGFNVLQFPQSVEKPSKLDNTINKLDKLIVMVIDGLRVDHMFMTERDLDSDAAVNLNYNKHMPYLSALLNKTQNSPRKGGDVNSSAEALAFEVITALPTVTLPRITSLVSGTVPGFFSMATNFQASTISQDSVIHRMKEKGYRLRMYGDDTWIKMFPTEFDVSDPVTSFFVTDYTEVDYNVTRHLNRLMSSDIDKWDVTILHYLGIDHIGHTHGSTDEKITKKLFAMDHVIKVLHQGLISSGSKYGLLVTGDHGMADGGGHGGATYHEIRTSAAFISNSPLYRSIQETYLIRQVDLACTIAGMMGVTVPVTSVGAPVHQLVRAVLDTHSLHNFYKYESHRLVDLLKKSGLPYGDASALITEAEWLEAKHIDDLYSAGIVSFDEEEGDRKLKPITKEVRSNVDRLLSLYKKSCRKASETLVQKVQMYDLPVLLPSALILALIAFVRLLSTVSHSLRHCPRYLSSKGAGSSVRFTLTVCTGCVMLLYLFSCGVSKGHTQLCQPMKSPTALYLLLPAVYGLYFATTLYSNLKETLMSGASSLTSKLKNVYFPYSTMSVWWREGNLVRDLLVVGTFCQTLSLLGTSFVEEEHLSFYFLHTSFSVCLLSITCLLLLNSLLIEDSKREENTVSIVDQASSSNQFESVLLRRNEEVRRNMRATYDQFGLTADITATNGGIDEADSKLDSAINKSETVNRKRIAYTIIQKLLLTLLCLIVYLSLFRISRMWISTGDKWKHLPDLEDMIRRQSRFTRQNLLILSGGITLVCLKGFRPLVLVSLALSFIETFTRPNTTTQREVVMANLSSHLANFAIVVIGFFQIRVLRCVLGRCQKHKLHNLTFLTLFFLGLETLNSFRKRLLLMKRRVSLLPTRTEMESVDFDKVVDRYGSTQYLFTYFLTYFNTSLALLWITLQRHDNVLQAALLLLQCEIFMRVVEWLSECGVAGISATGSLKRLRSHWNSIIALAVMWMAQAFYFAMGNSNSLSTIDVSRGFVGADSYHPFLHGFFIYVHTMGAPLYVYLRYIHLLLSSSKEMNGKEFFGKISLPSLFHGEGWYGAISSTMVLWWTVRLSVVGLYAVNLVLQRDHLFIWSVFTPKMVYEIAQLFNLFVVHVVLVFIAMFVNY